MKESLESFYKTEFGEDWKYYYSQAENKPVTLWGKFIRRLEIIDFSRAAHKLRNEGCIVEADHLDFIVKQIR